MTPDADAMMPRCRAAGAAGDRARFMRYASTIFIMADAGAIGHRAPAARPHIIFSAAVSRDDDVFASGVALAQVLFSTFRRGCRRFMARWLG